MRTVEKPHRARLYELELRNPSLAPTSTTRGAKPACDLGTLDGCASEKDRLSTCRYRR